MHLKATSSISFFCEKEKCNLVHMAFLYLHHIFVGTVDGSFSNQCRIGFLFSEVIIEIVHLCEKQYFFGKFFLFLTTDVIDVSPFHKIRLFDLIGGERTFCI